MLLTSRHLAILIALLLLKTNLAFGKVGEITTHDSVGQIVRGSDKIETSKGSGVEQNDDVKTGKGAIGITFEDTTKVKIDPNSSLVIDTFVYDPGTGKGSLNLKATLGTVRYASGILAKKDRKNVKISTPTANIAVRGTAFSMTVDEIGRSLIILLPNADGSVGEIEVSTEIGSVILNNAFQAAGTMSLEKPPSPPVQLKLNESQISNMLIVDEPKEVSNLWENPLDFDPLKFDDLDRPLLDFSALDINELDVDLLYNPLDNISDHVDGRTPGFNKTTQVNTIITETNVRVIRQVDGVFDVTLDAANPTMMIWEQGGQTGTIDTGDNPNNNITVIQR